MATIFTFGIDVAKNDATDAAAICEAIIPSNMRFVPIKSVEQHQ